MTEGFKWTDKPMFVNSKNYHIIRGITNITVIALPIISINLINVDIYKLVILSILISWPLYELSLNYVNFGKFLYQKGEFILGNLKLKHPPVILYPIISLISLITFFIIN